MDIRKLQRAIVDGLEDEKAHHIVVFNTEHLSPLFERVIIASGTSNRQTKALASSVRDAVKTAGMPVLSTEGGDNGEWIIVDCGAAVAHIMQPAIRDYYRLEEIWGGKPVKLKLAAEGTRLPKASEDKPAAPAVSARSSTRPASKKPASKTVARKAASAKVTSEGGSVGKAPARKAAAKPAGTAPARRPAAKKTAGRAALRTVGAKTAPATGAKTAARKRATRSN